MKQKYQFFVSPNEILSVKSFGLTLFDITDLSVSLRIAAVVLRSHNYDIKRPNDTDLPRYEFWPPKVLASIK